MRVLGIESSCDETGIAIYDKNQGLIANQVYSQIELHSQYGGIVPELASRDHIRKLSPLLTQALDEAKLSKDDLTGIAYTAGPGLIGALMAGASFAKSLAYALDIPAIAIHHMEGHLLAPLLDAPSLKPPFVALLVSGGHTQLVKVSALGRYELIGDTLDDAVGEAFDKTAKLLGLGYPGGPALEKLAHHGNNKRFKFPRPMINRPGLDFSFSGLKTFVLNTANNEQLDDQTKADIAACFQEAVVDTLTKKCQRAMTQTGINTLVVAGGVSANTALRNALNAQAKAHGSEVYFPKPAYCTDNGAMIAFCGFLRLSQNEQESLSINTQARWPLESLSDIKTTMR